MRRINFFLLLVICFVFNNSCDSKEEKREKSFNKNYLKVSENISKLDSLLNSSFKYANKYEENDSIIQFTQTTQMPKFLRIQLENLGIESIWIRKLKNDCIDAEFNTNWDYNLGSTRLTWTSCHPKDSGTAFYNHWGKQISIKQIDNRWWMWTTY